MRVSSTNANSEQCELCEEGGVSFGNTSLGRIRCQRISCFYKHPGFAGLYVDSEWGASLDGCAFPSDRVPFVAVNDGDFMGAGFIGDLYSGHWASDWHYCDGDDVFEPDILSGFRIPGIIPGTLLPEPTHVHY